MRLEKILSLALVLCVTAFSLPAEDKPEAWMGDSSGAQNIYSPNEIKEDLTFLKPLELGGMAAGAYLACRSGIMSRCMDSYRLKTDVWSVVGNTGLVIVTAFAGTVLGGVTTAFAFGPMDPEF